MHPEELHRLKFPNGEFVNPIEIDEGLIDSFIGEIEQFPKRLSSLTGHLSVIELNYPYRPGGWKIKQVVHHCADSHLNCLIRFKLALTEDNPTIRPYREDRWAELPDSLEDDLSLTLAFIEVLHKKLVVVLRALTSTDLKRTFVHPANDDQPTLGETIAQYAWHGNHHLAHIQQALRYKNQF